MFWRGEDSVLYWAWTTYARTHERYAQAMDDPKWTHITFHRLRTRREVDCFVAMVSAGPGDN